MDRMKQDEKSKRSAIILFILSILFESLSSSEPLLDLNLRTLPARHSDPAREQSFAQVVRVRKV